MNNNNETEIATVANGCFWCSEAIFRRLKGIKSVLPGYSGGIVKNPSYDQVCTGKTGHAESIQIEFDPKVIPFEKILDIFWHTHNPTTLNRQGSDIGTQYRSIILWSDDKQHEAVMEYLKKIKSDYSKPVVTEVKKIEIFYPAEEYHQRYFAKNPKNSYCQLVIAPKIAKVENMLSKAKD